MGTSEFEAVPGTGETAPASASEPERVEALRRGFVTALAKHPQDVRDERYVFAGRPVRLRVVGSGLAMRTHRAFAHLRRSDDPTPPMLSIDLWDETETAVAGLPESAATDLERKWLACDGLLTASPDGRFVSFRYRESVTILDRVEGRMIGCRRQGAHLSGGEYSKPLLMMLSIWYHDRGVQLLHTGLIAHAGVGVLLPGESGSGKSTTSLSGLEQGLGFLGDDFIGLERGPDGGFLGHSLFSTACVVRENLRRFPALQRHVVDDASLEEEKPILFLSEIFPERICATVPIRAVVLLRIRQEHTRILPARRADAMRHVAASTLHTVVPRPGRDALEMIGALLEAVPVWWLHLGPDLRDIPPAIARIVAGGDAAHAS